MSVLTQKMQNKTQDKIQDQRAIDMGQVVTENTKEMRFQAVWLHLRMGIAYLFVLGLVFGSSPLNAEDADNSQAKRERVYRLMEKFGSVFHQVATSYVEEVDEESMMENAINGMLRGLDPHSEYLNVKRSSDMNSRTRGEFGGLGIEVTMEDGYVLIVSPIDGTPATRVGLKSGDYITAIDGVSIVDLDLSSVVGRMRGPVGTSLTLTIVRNETSFDVEIERALIKETSVRKASFGRVGYVRISRFNKQTTSGLREQIEELEDTVEGGIVGLVVDLRNNPGGLLNEAITVADLLLDAGEIVSTRGRGGNNNYRYNAHSGDIIDGRPLVILINRGSASASEVVAGAIQDHRRGVIVGEQSFGKGSVQTIIAMQDGDALRLTTQRYYTPSGRSIQGFGIQPDIVVRPARIEEDETTAVQRESDLRGALKNEESKREHHNNLIVPHSADEAKQLLRDYQLARSVNLVEAMAIYHNREG